MTDKKATDAAIQEALLEMLEVKLAAFMGRADLSDSPPEDKVAIRAGFFLGVAAGMQMANTLTGSDGEAAAEAMDKDAANVSEELKHEFIPQALSPSSCVCCLRGASDSIHKDLPALSKQVALTSKRRNKVEKLEGDQLIDLLQIAWGIIANANGGDWDNETPEWKGAAERWRDKYHEGVLAHIDEDKMPVFPGIDLV